MDAKRTKLKHVAPTIGIGGFPGYRGGDPIGRNFGIVS